MCIRIGPMLLVARLRIAGFARDPRDKFCLDLLGSSFAQAAQNSGKPGHESMRMHKTHCVATVANGRADALYAPRNLLLACMAL